MGAGNLPVCIDLFCGLGGFTDGFKLAGWHVVGVDIVRYDSYQGDEFIQADILKLDGSRFRGSQVIVASPPCTEFARFRMPWMRSKPLPPPSMELVKAAYRIRDEAQPDVFLLENVRSAQYFLGDATLKREPFYFWGDTGLITDISRPKMRQKQSYSSDQQAERARIPQNMAYEIGLSILTGLNLETLQGDLMPKKSEQSVNYQERLNEALAEIQGTVTLEQVNQVALKHGVDTSGLLKFLDVDWSSSTATNPEK